jgi:hypothetical protein
MKSELTRKDLAQRERRAALMVLTCTTVRRAVLLEVVGSSDNE